MNSRPNIPTAVNEPILEYREGSPERAQLKAKLTEMAGQQIDVPLYIGGKEIKTGNTENCVCPHDHKHILGKYHKGTKEETAAAISAAMSAKKEWEKMPLESRAAIFLKAADLLAGPWRAVFNAATMLGQSKSAFQAEIDAACELADFWRFNAQYAQEIYGEQPLSAKNTWNYLEQRPLDGFVFAVTPFNFTSIAANLPTAPALMGNTVVWKPSGTAMFSAYYIMELLKEAGLPDGVVNMIAGSGAEIGNAVLSDDNFAGLHFTGSTEVFRHIWKQAGENIGKYKCYPRLVGETGGKDFIFAHSSADVRALAIAVIRGAFEYQGQKCSAASRAFIPKSIWPAVKEIIDAEIKTIKMGDVTDFSNFMNAVIDKSAFDRIKGYIDFAKNSSDAKVINGGGCDSKIGYFVEPTVILAETPHFKTMTEEIFGPVMTIFVYDDKKLDETLAVCDSASPYALTGAIFAQDRQMIVKMTQALSGAAGNFYINDKPTGAVVGQQPFGGSRASGTNDKAGSKINLMRWTSPRNIKENFVPPKDYRYPFMSGK